MKKILQIFLLILLFSISTSCVKASAINMLKNSGAESQTMVWWLEYSPVIHAIDSIGLPEGTVLPHSGNYFFSMAQNESVSDAVMHQFITNIADLAGEPYAAGGWIQTSISSDNSDTQVSNNDHGEFILTFLNNKGDAVVPPISSGPIGNSVPPSSEYINFQVSGYIPENTISAQYKLTGSPVEGPFINVYYDDLYFNLNDEDNDGFVDKRDNCPAVPNPNQSDTDNDAIGDACDLLDNRDDDGDSVQNHKDLCTNTSEHRETFTRMVTTYRWFWNGNALEQKANGSGKTDGTRFTIHDTLGCSCLQILDKLDTGSEDNYRAHFKFGCSSGLLESFANKYN